MSLRSAMRPCQRAASVKRARAASWAAHQMKAHEGETKNTALADSQLSKHNLSELQKQALNCENALAEEPGTQTGLTLNFQKNWKHSSIRINFELLPNVANLRTTLAGPTASMNFLADLQSKGSNDQSLIFHEGLIVRHALLE